MLIKEDPEFRKQILKQIAEREFYERKGTHGSDLIFCLNKQALRKLKPKPNTDEEILTFSIGWSTQRWLTGTFEPDTAIEVDGIVVTPDVIPTVSISGGFPSSPFPWELKATFQSNTKPIEENLHWIRQLMAECYVTKSLVAILSRFEIMGNWKWVYHPTKPETIAKIVEELGTDWEKHPTLHAWRVEFTQDELEGFWQWMRERKVLYEEILRTSVLLPKVVALAGGQEWECGFCSYKKECEK